MKRIIQSEIPVRRERVRKKGLSLIEKIDWHIETVSKRKKSDSREHLLANLKREKETVNQKYFSAPAGRRTLPKSNPEK